MKKIMRLEQRANPYLPAVYALLFVVVAALTALTPMVADDFSYCFSWLDDSRIKSIGQIVESMAVHRQVTNGRVILHGMVQFILMFPKVVFNLLNGLNAVLIAFLFSRCLNQGKPARTAGLLILAAVLLWNFTPAFGQVFLWLDGAMNYAWSVCLCLLFLGPFISAYLGTGKKWGWGRNIAFIPLCFVFGACAESYVPASMAAAGVLGLAVWKKEKKLPAAFLLWAVFALLGYLFLMTAPAVSGRTGGFVPAVMAATLKDIIAETKDKLLVLYMIYAGLLVLSYRADRKKVFLSVILAAAGLLSLVIYVFAAYFTERHFLYAVVLTVLACIILVEQLLEMGKRELISVFAAGSVVLFCFNFAQGLMDITVVYSHSKQREQIIEQAKSEGETELALQKYVASTKYSAPYMLDDLTEDPDAWPNTSVALYYGLNGVTGYLPE